MFCPMFMLMEIVVGINSYTITLDADGRLITKPNYERLQCVGARILIFFGFNPKTIPELGKL
jgi:hypothetical protein